MLLETSIKGKSHLQTELTEGLSTGFPFCGASAAVDAEQPMSGNNKAYRTSDRDRKYYNYVNDR